MIRKMRLSKANTSFWLIWFCAVLWCCINSYDDPSSLFFSRRRAFRRNYSARREEQVEAFIEKIESQGPSKFNANAKANEFLCVGIPSVNRTDKEYLRTSVGSLLDSLGDEEKAQVYLVVLLADRDPRMHASYGADWLSTLADEVLVYDYDETKDPSPAEGKRSTKEPGDAYRVIKYDKNRGRGDGHSKDTRMDHSVLVEACRHHGSPYFIMLEDDVITTRDWLQRTWRGIAALEDARSGRKDGKEVAKRAEKDWLYLRLFHSEMLMGWNNEEILDYVEIIIVVYLTLAALIYLAVRCRRRRRRAQRHRHYKTLELRVPQSYSFSYIASLALGLWTPACIVLFFLAGRVTLHRLTMTKPTVREMPEYGCCAQGYVFPSRHLEGLQSMLRKPPFQFPVDMAIEGYADNKGLTKWALDPSVLQHLGLVEPTKEGKFNAVWNFSFERLR